MTEPDGTVLLVSGGVLYEVDPATGVDRLLAWISGNRAEIADFLAHKGIRVAAV